jgi:hypothetical protein
MQVIDLFTCWRKLYGSPQSSAMWNMVSSTLLWCLWRKINDKSFEAQEDGGGIEIFFLQYSLPLDNSLDFPNVLDFHVFLNLFSPSILARCLSCILYAYRDCVFSLFNKISITYKNKNKNKKSS